MTSPATIFANKYSATIDFLMDTLRDVGKATVILREDNIFAPKCLDSKILFFVGDTSQMKRLVAETFELTMFHDSFFESSVQEYFKKSKQVPPAQHILDKLCALPDTFNNYPPKNVFQCGCYGEVNKKLVFVLPDDLQQVSEIFPNYISKLIERLVEKQPSKVYKIFSLSKNSVQEKLSLLENAKYVSQHCETVADCDFRLRVVFKKSATKAIISAYDTQLKKVFGHLLYGETDTTLQGEIVSILSQMKKRVAIAESLTGGLISSKLVDISGASKVLYEGLVTYTSESKSNRLKLNPLFIDKVGVVSSQVAHGMAESLLNDGHAEFSVATTGFADSFEPANAGLCFVGVGSQKSIKVYRFKFHGNRQQVRNQAANSALFLLLSLLKGKNISFENLY